MNKTMKLAIVGIILSALALVVALVGMVRNGADGNNIVLVAAMTAVFLANVVLLTSLKKKDKDNK